MPTPDHIPAQTTQAELRPRSLSGYADDAPLVQPRGEDPVEIYRTAARLEIAKRDARIEELEAQVKHLQNPESKTQAQTLIDLAARASLFHSPEGDAYASVAVGTHTEHYPLRSGNFRNWLRRGFYELEAKPPGSQALQDAIGALEARAQYEGERHEVFLRTGWHEGTIYVDLCNDAWEAVRVTADGWRIVQNPPVRFRRTKGMLPLSKPAIRGDLSCLTHLMGLRDDGGIALLCAYLAASLRPTGPYPILNLQGEQGSGKSTKSRQIRSLIDPSVLSLRTQPRNEQDVLIAAHNSWVLALDNLSGLPHWLSDALCRLSTGGGFGTRQLYKDKEESLFYAMRPVLLNGIEDLAVRPDLADRCITINVPRIAESERKTEREVWADFEQNRPTILAGVFDMLSAALKNFDYVELTDLPRMADFAKWSVAAERVFPVPEGTFITAYTTNRKEAVDVAVQSDTVASAIIDLLDKQAIWEGSASELIADLKPLLPNPEKPPRDFPATPQAMTGRLRRIMPALRAVGIEKIEMEREIKRRPFRLVKQKHDVHDVVHFGARHAENGVFGIKNRDYDVHDVHDVSFPFQSKGGVIEGHAMHGDGQSTKIEPYLEQEHIITSNTSSRHEPAKLSQNRSFSHDVLHDALPWNVGDLVMTPLGTGSLGNTEPRSDGKYPVFLEEVLRTEWFSPGELEAPF